MAFQRHAPATERQDGLTALLGGAARIAAAMGADETMARPVMAALQLTVCETCAVEREMPIAAMTEVAT